jgi:arylsulfatase
VSNEIVHQVDLFPTLAAAIGADIVPRDRAIDGVNQLPFLEGKQPNSNRDNVIYFTHLGLMAVKWRDWKVHYRFMPSPVQPIEPGMRVFNLRSDPKEESDVKDGNPWVTSVTDKIIADFMATTARYPHVPPNAPDSYAPPARSP